MSRQPWMKWYPADWRADPGLRMCSFAARGLWADILALMHEAEPYGHLLVNGISPSSRQLAALLGGSEREITTLLSELEEAGVFSRAAGGDIISRRMVRDHEKRERDKANGRTGGNPSLMPPAREAVNPPHNRSRNGYVNGQGNSGVQRGDKAQKLEARKIPSQEGADSTNTHCLRTSAPPDDVAWDDDADRGAV